MTHLFGKWQELEVKKKLATKYGDNAKLISKRKAPVVLDTQPFSFPHLLNKVIQVPVLKRDPRFKENFRRTYHI